MIFLHGGVVCPAELLALVASMPFALAVFYWVRCRVATWWKQRFIGRGRVYSANLATWAWMHAYTHDPTNPARDEPRLGRRWGLYRLLHRVHLWFHYQLR